MIMYNNAAGVTYLGNFCSECITKRTHISWLSTRDGNRTEPETNRTSV